MIGIYCIENKINNKKYVGQSRNLEKRMFQNHKECCVLFSAIEKYGIENFNIYIIHECEEEMLNENEIFYIRELSSHVSENGYNVSWGGSTPSKNRKLSRKTRNKISKNNSKYWTGKKRSSETIEKIIKTKTGTKASNKTKEKMRKIRIGNKQSNGITSSFVGVYKRNDNGKYRSSIKFKGTVYRLGSFENEEDAARAYDEMYMKLNKTKYAPNLDRYNKEE